MDYVEALSLCTRYALRTLLGEPEGYVRPAKQTAPTGTMATDFATLEIQEIGERCAPVIVRGAPPENIEATSMEYMLDAYDQFQASVQFYRARVQAVAGDPGAFVDAAGIPDHSQWALSRALHLTKMLHSPKAREVLQPIGLGFVRVRTKPKDLAFLADTNWESRAEVGLEFGIVNRQVLAVQILAGVAGQLKFASPGGDAVTITIEVPL